jgi:hypothetical protein
MNDAFKKISTEVVKAFAALITKIEALKTVEAIETQILSAY